MSTIVSDSTDYTCSICKTEINRARGYVEIRTQEESGGKVERRHSDCHQQLMEEMRIQQPSFLHAR